MSAHSKLDYVNSTHNLDMTEELISLPTDKLLNKFGSGGHKPGSGSAAALLGLIACKLIQTVVTLSNGRDQYQGVDQQLTLANQKIIEDIEPFLINAVQEDSLQFGNVIDARRLRDAEKETNLKKILRNRALKELKLSTEIPLQIAELCIEIAKQAIVVFDLGFKSARGDSGVAISSALSGASGAISIVYLNLTSYRGSKWATKTREKVDPLLIQTQELQSELFIRVGRLKQEVIDREPGKPKLD